MARLRAGGLSIFAQTLLLLIAALILAQALAIALVIALPAPRPDFARLSDLADALAGVPPDQENRERPLQLRIASAPPVPGPGMIAIDRFTRRLADRLDAPPQRVRLHFEPDRRNDAPWRERRHQRRFGGGGRGEPLFFDRVVAAYDTGAGWRIVSTPPRPLIAAWQRRLLIFFLISGLLMLPLAWLFARRLTRPIRLMAEAADRLGGEAAAPPMPVEGPSELRVMARALNRMQARIADYVRERTAMVGAIAHDLRTPLARIAFRIEAAPEDVRAKVHEDIEQMRAMIAATIGFVRNATRSEARVAVDLARLLNELAARDSETGRAVSLVAAVPATVAGDPSTLARLFQNLVDNAVSYGGAARIALTIDAARAVVTVADDGPGLAPALIGRVFNPFERGEPSRSRQTGGIGLGLTIARAITEDHGGALTLANGAERGLVARVELPLAT